MDLTTQAKLILETHFSQWLSNPKRMENGYEYESTYAEMMQKAEKDILQLSVGKVPKSINSKKKLQTPIWKNRTGQKTRSIKIVGHSEHK